MFTVGGDVFIILGEAKFLLFIEFGDLDHISLTYLQEETGPQDAWCSLLLTISEFLSISRLLP